MAIIVPDLAIDVDFTHIRGTTFEFTFTIRDKKTKEPVDFGVGATAKMVFKTDINVPTPDLLWDATGGVVTVTPAAGTIAIVGPDTDMDPAWDTANYGIVVTHSDGKVKQYYEGNFNMRRGII